MTTAHVQSAARFLDEHCRNRGLQTLIAVEGNLLVVYGQNRRAYRKATKLLATTWQGLAVSVRQLAHRKA